MTGRAMEESPLLPKHFDGDRSLKARARRHFSSEVVLVESYFPLFMQCFLSGMIDATVYSTSAIWVAFMTGNMAQLSIDLTEFAFKACHSIFAGAATLDNGFPPNAASKDSAILPRSFALIGFSAGSYIAGRLGARYGSKNRGKLTAIAVMQALITLSVLLQSLPHPDWLLRSSPHMLGLLALSMGLQSASASGLTSPAYGTTVVFTGTLTDLCADPRGHAGQRRLLSIVALVLGAFAGQAMLGLVGFGTPRAMRVALGGVAVTEVIIALAWAFGSGGAWKRKSKEAIRGA